MNIFHPFTSGLSPHSGSFHSRLLPWLSGIKTKSDGLSDGELKTTDGISDWISDGKFRYND